MRVVAWNIRAGGGIRADAIARQIARWQPDVAVLSEFRATPPSVRLAGRLAASGLTHQLATCDPRTEVKIYGHDEPHVCIRLGTAARRP